MSDNSRERKYEKAFEQAGYLQPGFATNARQEMARMVEVIAKGNKNFTGDKLMVEKFKEVLDYIVKIIHSILTKFTKKEIDNEVLDALVNEKTKIQNLDGKIIAKWFREKLEVQNGQPKMVLSYIDAELLIKYGFSINDDVKISNILLQFLYDEEFEKMIESRLIRFENIDTNLQAQLEENSGLLVFSK